MTPSGVPFGNPLGNPGTTTLSVFVWRPVRKSKEREFWVRIFGLLGWGSKGSVEGFLEVVRKFREGPMALLPWRLSSLAKASAFWTTEVCSLLFCLFLFFFLFLLFLFFRPFLFFLFLFFFRLKNYYFARNHIRSCISSFNRLLNFYSFFVLLPLGYNMLPKFVEISAWLSFPLVRRNTK